MPSTQFKLTRNSHTRRLTLQGQPSWLVLATRIESYFKIPLDKLAVAYIDPDGDKVTLNSQEELSDYFANCHKSGAVVKFDVVDLVKLRSDEANIVFDEDNGPSVRMGPTMVYGVNDHDWTHFPSLFPGGNTDLLARSDDGSITGQAYVETVNSDEASLSKRSNTRPHSVLSASSKGSTNTLKGKGKGVDKTTRDSVQSFHDDDNPFMNTVHPKQVPDADILGLGESGLGMQGNEMGARPSHSPVYAGSRGAYAFPPNRTNSASDHVNDPFEENIDQESSEEEELSTPLLKVHRAGVTTRQSPLFDSEMGQSTWTNDDPVHVSRTASVVRDTGEPKTQRVESPGESDAEPTQSNTEQTQRSFIDDITGIIDAFTSAFSTHPELAEGVRNIVRGATSGAYWSIERERAMNAAESVRRSAEETSMKIRQVANEVRYEAEQQASRRIAQSLSAVFGVISDLSGGSSSPPADQHHAGDSDRVHHPSRGVGWNRYPWDWNDGPFQLPPPPPPPLPFGPPVPPLFGPTPGHITSPHPFFYPGRAQGVPLPPPPPPPPVLGDGPQHSPVPPHMRTRPWAVPPALSQGIGAWPASQPVGGNRDVTNTMGPANPITTLETQLGHPPNVHEMKAHLDAAKAYYRTQKETFKKEKEERRRVRREQAEKRAEEGLNITEGAETIVARIPLGVHGEVPQSLGMARHKSMPYAEVYGVPASSRTRPRARLSSFPGRAAPQTESHQAQDKREKAIARLSEMGITQAKYPELNSLLDEHINSTNTEEAALAKILNKLLTR